MANAAGSRVNFHPYGTVTKLIDGSRSVLAVAYVTDEGDHYGGTVNLRGTPAGLRALFDKFEEIVNGQLFSFLNEIQEKIASVPITVVFENGREVEIKDLQVFPSTGGVSFKLAEVPSAR